MLLSHAFLHMIIDSTFLLQKYLSMGIHRVTLSFSLITLHLLWVFFSVSANFDKKLKYYEILDEIHIHSREARSPGVLPNAPHCKKNIRLSAMGRYNI